jgi:hypothetical protein
MNRGLGSLVLLTTLGVVAGCTDEPVVATPIEPTPDSLATPPPISGGTLAITEGLAVASDPTVDKLFIVDIAGASILREVVLTPGDQPGRVVKGGAGEVFVVLRGGGAVAQIDLADGAVKRVPVCAAPRGIDYDEATDQLFVACVGGELAIFNGDLELASMMQLDRDLRDVVFVNGKIVVSRFRSAEVLVVDPLVGRTTARSKPMNYMSPNLARQFEATVAWRMQELPNGNVAVVHQRALLDPVPGSVPEFPEQGSYTGSGSGLCDEVIVHAAVTQFDPDAPDAPVTTTNAGGAAGPLVLPVDMAVSPDGATLAVAGAGNDVVYRDGTNFLQTSDGMLECFIAPPEFSTPLPKMQPVAGEPVAVAFADNGNLVVQTRQPAGLVLSNGARVEFGGASRRQIGHSMFHRAASPVSPLACASCHPEGREDGRVWNFQDVGARRTQDISGGVLETKPFHWDGAFDDMHAFMSEIFVNRMGGSEMPVDRISGLEEWIDQLDHVPTSAPADGAAVARGEELFFSDALACSSCHAGAKLTNNTTVEVGTGRPLQVPSLIGLWSRAPYMHDGCAATLRDRFATTSSCGGGDFHGKTSQLNEAQVDDLITYLESL